MAIIDQLTDISINHTSLNACGLDIILALIFVTFSTLRTLSFSDLRFYESLETVGIL